jgi:hypothetical protein
MGFMRASDTWGQFITSLDIAFPRRGDTLKIPFMANTAGTR